MEDEYDFTAGVRGKYADRYREVHKTREPLPLDLSTFHEVQSRIRYALWQTQALEGAIVAFLALVGQQSAQSAGNMATELFERANNVTVSKILKDREVQVGVTPDLAQRLQEFINQRNWLVHSFRHQHAADLYSAVRTYDLVQSLEVFSEEAMYLTKVFYVLTQESLEKKGIAKEELEARSEEVIGSWISALGSDSSE